LLNPDQVTPKLAALHYYQLSLKAPTPPAGSFDPAVAKRGEVVFNGQGKCAECHMPPLYTDAGYNAHTPAECASTPSRPTAGRGDRQHAGHAAAQRPLGAVEARILPRRPFSDAPGCGRPLQCLFQPIVGLSRGQETDLVEFLKSR
jgi:hypothetical protein